MSAAFSGEFQPIEIYVNTYGVLDETVLIDAVRWLFTEKYPYSRRFILDNYSTTFLKEHSMFKRTKREIPIYELISAAFPEEHFHPWEFKCTPMNYWNESTAKDALKYILLDKYKVDTGQIKSVINIKTLTKDGLATLVTKYSISHLLDVAYSILREQEEKRVI